MSGCCFFLQAATILTDHTTDMAVIRIPIIHTATRPLIMLPAHCHHRPTATSNPRLALSNATTEIRTRVLAAPPRATPPTAAPQTNLNPATEGFADQTVLHN
jgi:hypothetical protein